MHTGFRSFRSCGIWAQLRLAGSRGQAQQLWSMSLVASQHVGSSQARDWTSVPCTGRQICNHWITREVQFPDIFDDRYSDLCEVIPHFILVCISLIITDIQHLFICLLAICLYPLEKCLVKSSAYSLVLIFFSTLSCVSCLYVLDINLFSVTSFANMFPHSVGYLFNFLLYAKAFMFECLICLFFILCLTLKE